MEPAPYVTDAEKVRRYLVERYLSLKQNFVSDSCSEKYPWLDDSSKNRYNSDVNINNWIEERSDTDYIKHRRPLLNEFNYAYKTEYKHRFGDHAGGKIIPTRKYGSYPGHQPQLDDPLLKNINIYQSISRISYQDPRLIARKPKGKCQHCQQTM